MTKTRMVSLLPTSQKGIQAKVPQIRKALRPERVFSTIASFTVIATSLWAGPSFADDPFRTNSPHAIGDQTEAAFKAIFEDGDYKSAREYLQQAEPNEPLAYAMKASLAYIDRDWNGLGENARQTRETAERLVESDPLRGRLYTAVGHFLEGAHALTTQGTVRGTPVALAKLQQVFDNLNAAERISSNDPELNLLKGYMDLMLAVNLPFSNPTQAIDRLENYASPAYVAQRGIAVGYRDLGQQDKAMVAVEEALQAAPDNPDLIYLKAQILVRQGREQDSLAFFRQALEKGDQLPRNLFNQIAWEECRTNNRVNRIERDCSPLLSQ